MKKTLLIFLVLIISACSSNNENTNIGLNNNNKDVVCKKVEMIDRTARLIIKSSAENDTVSLYLYTCFQAIIYKSRDKDILKIIASEEKEEEFVKSGLEVCRQQLKGMTKEKYARIEGWAQEALDMLDENQYCLK